MEKIQYKEPDSIRLDKYLSDCLGITRNKVQDLIDAGHVTINQKQTKASYRLQADDWIEYTLEPANPNLLPENITIPIVFEDENLLIVNKPRGLLTHPTPKIRNNTLVNALLYHQRELSQSYGEERAGIVHRIDRDTSGLLIVAKNNKTHDYIAGMLKDRLIQKYYIALIHGRYPHKKASISLPLTQNVSRRKIEVNASGRYARTDMTVIKLYKEYTLVRLQIFTGRTHQIRVHLAHIGYPVVGDRVYGKEDEFQGGQVLHAHQLGLILPNQEKVTYFFAPMPEYFLQILRSLPV